MPYFEDATYKIYIAIFYIAFAILGFAILDVFYLKHAQNKKKFTFTWPIHALRIILQLFNTVLFIPLFAYFASVLSCVRNGEDKLVHYIFSEVECWNGIYFLHAIIAIISIITFLYVCFISSLLLFECRASATHATARYFFLYYSLEIYSFFNFFFCVY